MDLLSNLALGFATAATPANLAFCLVGVVIGTLVGVLPGISPLTTVAMLLGLDRVTGNSLFVPSLTAGALPTDTVGVSLALMVLVTLVAAPKAAFVGALMLNAKVSAGSPSGSFTVAVRTVTLVTPAGMVRMPLAGTGKKVAPPSVL